MTCDARLEVTIGLTTYSMRCGEPAGHASREHRTEKGNTWVATGGAR